jgi:hypothetical protein
MPVARIVGLSRSILQLLARWPMDLILTFVLSAVLLTPVRPTGVQPDSGSVAVTTAAEWLRDSTTGGALWDGGVDEWLSWSSESSQRRLIDPGEALALLMAEHRLSIPIQVRETAGYHPPLFSQMDAR